MLDLIITSYKLTMNMSSYLLEYTQYLEDYTFNIRAMFRSLHQKSPTCWTNFVWANAKALKLFSPLLEFPWKSWSSKASFLLWLSTASSSSSLAVWAACRWDVRAGLAGGEVGRLSWLRLLPHPIINWKRDKTNCKVLKNEIRQGCCSAI